MAFNGKLVAQILSGIKDHNYASLLRKESVLLQLARCPVLQTQSLQVFLLHLRLYE